jgi:hypothetical protein
MTPAIVIKGICEVYSHDMHNLVGIVGLASKALRDLM